MADLLLYGRADVKAKAKEVEAALGEANNLYIVELAKAAKDVKEGQWQHANLDHLETILKMWQPALFYDKVWPLAQELAEIMAAEIASDPAPPT